MLALPTGSALYFISAASSRNPILSWNKQVERYIGPESLSLGACAMPTKTSSLIDVLRPLEATVKARTMTQSMPTVLTSKPTGVQRPTRDCITPNFQWSRSSRFGYVVVSANSKQQASSLLLPPASFNGSQLRLRAQSG